MTLLDRVNPDLETRTIDFHSFSSAIFFWIKGDFSRTQFKSVLGLDATDDAQIDQVLAFFQGLTQTEKDRFRDTVESAGILWETGRITESQFKTLIGVS